MRIPQHGWMPVKDGERSTETARGTWVRVLRTAITDSGQGARLIIRVWSSPSEARRSTSSRRTASCWSLTTGRSPDIRVPTSATEWASVASVLRPWPGGEDPRSCREHWRDVDDLVPFGDQPHDDVTADAVAPFDGPDPVRPLGDVLEHRLEAGGVGAEAATTQDRFIRSHDLDGHRPLVRVHPDHDPFIRCLHDTVLLLDP